MAEKNKKPKQDIMHMLASSIVRYRFLIMGLFLAAAIFCALSISKVKVNEDITAFLPDETETRQGLTIMEDEFITYASANVMISNITYDRAEKIAEEIKKREHVSDVTLDETFTIV